MASPSLFSRLRDPSSLSLSSYSKFSHPLTIFTIPRSSLSSTPRSLRHWGAQDRTRDSRRGVPSAAEGEPCPDPDLPCTPQPGTRGSGHDRTPNTFQLWPVLTVARKQGARALLLPIRKQTVLYNGNGKTTKKDFYTLKF